MNIVFLSAAKGLVSDAGAKRSFYQANYLAAKFDVHVLFIKGGNQETHDRIKTVYGKLNVFSSLYKLRRNSNKNVLILGSLIDLRNLPFVVFGRLLGYKVVLDKVENFALQDDKTSIYYKVNLSIGLLFDKFIRRFSDGLIVISTSLYDQYVNISLPLLLLPNSVVVINHNDEAEVKRHRPNDPFTFLYTGTFAKKDGVSMMIEAFRLARNTNTRKMQLNLVGKGSEDNEQEIKNLIFDDEDIVWHGYVSQERLMELQRRSNVLTMTRVNSEYARYGFPYKVTEYLCFGNPILATRVGDIERYLEHGVTAILAYPTVDDISQKIKFCLENEDEIIEIGKTGLKKALPMFDIEINGPKMAKFLNGLFA